MTEVDSNPCTGEQRERCYLSGQVLDSLGLGLALALGLRDAFLHIGNGVCYRLVGAVNHHKLSLGCSHYTSCFLDHKQNQWFHADDEKVQSYKEICNLERDCIETRLGSQGIS